MARKQSQNSAGTSETEMDANVDKIREILFGGQMRDYEQRFRDLEGRLTKQIAQLSATFEKRMEKLHGVSQREIDKLAEILKTERKARLDEGKRSARDLKELGEQVETWCAELEEQIDGEVGEMRALLQESNDGISAEIQDACEQLNTKFDTQVQQLGNSRIAHEDLAALLADAARQLKKAPR